MESMLVCLLERLLLLLLVGRSDSGAPGAAVLQREGIRVPQQLAQFALLPSSVVLPFSGQALLWPLGLPHAGGQRHGASASGVKVDVKAVRRDALLGLV